MKLNFLTVAIVAGTALCLTACGSSGTTDASSGGTSAPAAPSGGTSAPAGGTSAPGAPGQGKDVDVCSALPASAASQITGTKFTSTKSSDVEKVVFNCEYRGPGTSLLQITVDTQFGSREFGNDVSALKAVGHPPTKISGVGDEAFSEPKPGNAGALGASSFASYGAVFGDTYIKVGGLTYVNADQGKQIVEQLHDNL